MTRTCREADVGCAKQVGPFTNGHPEAAYYRSAGGSKLVRRQVAGILDDADHLAVFDRDSRTQFRIQAIEEVAVLAGAPAGPLEVALSDAGWVT